VALTIPTQTITATSTIDINNPIDDAQIWETYSINGTPAPGIIEIDGIRGFARETEWDAKKGKGQRGAILTLTQYPLAKGSITSLLWKPAHFSAWNSFVDTLLTYSSNKTSQTNAATIDHPALALLDITTVVVAAVHPIRHRGKKLYSVTVDFIEWAPPPQASVVSTPKQADVVAPTLPGNNPPALAAAQAAHFAALARHAAAAAGAR